MPSKVWHEIACFRRGPFTVTVDRAKDPLLFKKRYRAVVSVCGVDVGKTYGTDQADVVARASRTVDRAVDEFCMVADDVAVFSESMGAA